MKSITTSWENNEMPVFNLKMKINLKTTLFISLVLLITLVSSSLCFVGFKEENTNSKDTNG